MKYEELKVDGYERVVVARDNMFQAIVAIHNTNLGPALGGCRIYNYKTYEDQLEDALRLAKGMTYKSALAGLQLGGGKSTIKTDLPKDEAMLLFGEVMNYINGTGRLYTTAGDVGTSPADLEILAQVTPYVNIGNKDEDSGFATAYGVYMAMLGALDFHQRDLSDQVVGIEGLGKVGYRLHNFLNGHCADVSGYDLLKMPPGVKYNYRTEVREADVYAPCALGGVLCRQNIGEFHAGQIICGGANNIFKCKGDSVSFAAMGITVVPDYLANAGGVIIIDSNYQDASYRDPGVFEKLRNIQFTTRRVLERARDEKHPPKYIADRMAEEIFNG